MPCISPLKIVCRELLRFKDKSLNPGICLKEYSNKSIFLSLNTLVTTHHDFVHNSRYCLKRDSSVPDRDISRCLKVTNCFVTPGYDSFEIEKLV